MTNELIVEVGFADSRPLTKEEAEEENEEDEDGDDDFSVSADAVRTARPSRVHGRTLYLRFMSLLISEY